MTLEGLKSQCRIPAAWAAARPRAAARTTGSASRIDRDGATHSWSEVPWISSRAMKIPASYAPTSNADTTLGCDNLAIACASCSSSACSFMERDATTFSAMSRDRYGSCAR